MIFEGHSTSSTVASINRSCTSFYWWFDNVPVLYSFRFITTCSGSKVYV